MVEQEGIRDFGVTSDILSYRLCPRRYGFFKHRKFTQAANTALFYGKTIHQTLDYCHLFYSGRLDGTEGGQVPSMEQVSEYFSRVEMALKAQGISSVNRDVRNHALAVVQLFNLLLGNYYYGMIEDTECHLRAVRVPDDGASDQYIVSGVVDVIVDDAGAREIWDYKGGKIDSRTREYKYYELQAKGYCYLYEEEFGARPKLGRVVYLGDLYKLVEKKARRPVKGFLFEEDVEGRLKWNGAWGERLRREIRNPVEVLGEISQVVPFDRTQVDEALRFFDKTVRKIREELKKPFHRQWKVRAKPRESACTFCEFKYSCKTRKPKENVPPLY
ncbi:MAG: hypothetical protein Kow0069_30640 [Promethearchaeota archaeon]